MESLYYGGSATALEVLDAYTAMIDAEVTYSQALDRYRVAEAQSIRWGTP
jgi:outer membrane protein TolC